MRCPVHGKSQKSASKDDVFASRISGRAPRKLLGAFVNRHPFRPTGQVWLTLVMGRHTGYWIITTNERFRINLLLYLKVGHTSISHY